MLSKEEIERALNSNEPYFFTKKEIEQIYFESVRKENIEILNLRNAYYSSFLEAMYLKAFKVDRDKAEKISEINEYLKDTLSVQVINNINRDLINSLNRTLIKKDLKIQSLEEKVKRLMKGI